MAGPALLTRRSYWRAAVIACGAGAVLSHRSAAQLWRMAELIAGSPHVTIPRSRFIERCGIVVHRSRNLGHNDVTKQHGIPVTTPARTLIDFAGRAAHYELRAAARAAAKHDRLDVGPVGRMCDEARGHKGTARLRALIAEDYGPVQVTASPLEGLLLQICADYGIRYPLVNVPVLEYTVDCLWLPERLVVELDGYDAHGGREGFESDRVRDVELAVAGYPVQRFTHRRLTRDRAAVARDVTAMLARLAPA